MPAYAPARKGDVAFDDAAADQVMSATLPIIAPPSRSPRMVLRTVEHDVSEIAVEQRSDDEQHHRHCGEHLDRDTALGREGFEPQILKSLAANYAKQNKMKEAYDKMLEYDKAREKIYNEEST